MKNLILALITLFSLNSVAGGADQEKVVLECSLLLETPDRGLDLRVLEGGFTGLTRIEISESYVWGVQKSKFYVRADKLTPKEEQEVASYTGNGIQLRVSFLNAGSDGRYSGFVTYVNKMGQSRSEQLACDAF